ncbi:hypothetical protein [Aeromonas phage 4L372D]|uniref:Uncharacterized protein n=1 Tax=Aeromonas phage 4L372D TaxID=2588518 RepID=A0A5B9NAP5_9CAUD|nr:hypothetical protein HWC27_gp020 [Aeromonas phage 4L372D]YP_009846575.1 hypothetical protein HWC27_gp027 [Aeromonas phage 4L372D]YP_009846792.1 hypothetical protein HWC27_gp147 [Aeromonas phage 4L372D]QEG08484.1 hypothetical protein [Aeromonas phage 4L372D]QEG08491.1 hypothetical protein [Aeromonas phage 4L372D]QEG08708.1 hypothetical protein [Aeromonas phage 4L372D]
MEIEVYKTMIVGSYRVYIGEKEYWATPSENQVRCGKRMMAESTKIHKQIMNAVNNFMENQKVN